MGRKQQSSAPRSIAEYLERTDDPDGRRLAERLGISRQRMRLYIKRLAVPRPDMLERLHAETSVPIESLLYLDRPSKSEVVAP